jgi:hypothetical protein
MVVEKDNGILPVKREPVEVRFRLAAGSKGNIIGSHGECL